MNVITNKNVKVAIKIILILNQNVTNVLLNVLIVNIILQDFIVKVVMKDIIIILH